MKNKKKQLGGGGLIGAGIGVATGLLSGIARKKQLKAMEEKYNNQLLNASDEYADTRTNPNYFGDRDSTIAQQGGQVSSTNKDFANRYNAGKVTADEIIEYNLKNNANYRQYYYQGDELNKRKNELVKQNNIKVYDEYADKYVTPHYNSEFKNAVKATEAKPITKSKSAPEFKNNKPTLAENLYEGASNIGKGFQEIGNTLFGNQGSANNIVEGVKQLPSKFDANEFNKGISEARGKILTLPRTIENTILDYGITKPTDYLKSLSGVSPEMFNEVFSTANTAISKKLHPAGGLLSNVTNEIVSNPAKSTQRAYQQAIPLTNLPSALGSTEDYIQGKEELSDVASNYLYSGKYKDAANAIKKTAPQVYNASKQLIKGVSGNKNTYKKALKAKNVIKKNTSKLDAANAARFPLSWYTDDAKITSDGYGSFENGTLNINPILDPLKEMINPKKKQQGGMLSSTSKEIGGKYHSQGGTPMQLGNEQVELEKDEVLSKLPDGSDYVFSRVLPNKGKGENFADEVKGIEKTKGKLEKKLKSNPTNSILQENIELLNNETQKIAQKQEQFKQEMGLENVEYIPELEQDKDYNEDGINDVLTNNMKQLGFKKRKQAGGFLDFVNKNEGLIKGIGNSVGQVAETAINPTSTMTQPMQQAATGVSSMGNMANSLLQKPMMQGGGSPIFDIANGVIGSAFPQQQEVDMMRNKTDNFVNPYQQQMVNNLQNPNNMMQMGLPKYQLNNPSKGGLLDFAKSNKKSQPDYSDPYYLAGLAEYEKRTKQQDRFVGADNYEYIKSLGKNPYDNISNTPTKTSAKTNPSGVTGDVEMEIIRDRDKQNTPARPFNPITDGRLNEQQVNKLIQEKGFDPRKYESRQEMLSKTRMSPDKVSTQGIKDMPQATGKISKLEMNYMNIPEKSKKFKKAQELGVDVSGMDRKTARETNRLSRRLLRDEKKGRMIKDGVVKQAYKDALNRGEVNKALDVYYDTNPMNKFAGQQKNLLDGKDKLDLESNQWMPRTKKVGKKRGQYPKNK